MNNSKFKIAIAIASLLLLLGGRTARCQTPITYRGALGPGVPQTNPVVIEPYPAANKWIVYNVTNEVYIVPTTNQPDATGYFSNNFYPTGYRLTIPALNAVMYFTVPNTLSNLSIAQCATLQPASGPLLSGYGLITNWLGYAPPTPNFAGITTALGYTPPTNTFVALTNIFGYIPATNSYSALTNILNFIPATNGGALVYSQLPWTPPTNTPSGMTYALGFQPATNPPILLTTNITFWGTNSATGTMTNRTLNITNGTVQGVSTP